jgi:hypothetical protein
MFNRVCNRQSILGVISSLAILVAALDASASTLITFDDLSNPSEPAGDTIANGYAGLNWSNFVVLNATNYPIVSGNASGYPAGIVSPNNVAVNNFGNAATFSSPSGTFNLLSFYATAAWNDDMTLTITGLRGGGVIDTTSALIQTSGPSFFNLDWLGIDTVTFETSGGVANPNFCCGGDVQGSRQFALDNVSVELNPTPIPAALPLFATGIGAIGLLGWRRKRKAQAA